MSPDPFTDHGTTQALLDAGSLEELAGLFLPIAVDAGDGEHAVTLVLRPEEGPPLAFTLRHAGEAVQSLAMDRQPAGSGGFTVHAPGVGISLMGLPMADFSWEQAERFHGLVALMAARVSGIVTTTAWQRKCRRSTQMFESLDCQIHVLERERQKFSMMVNKTEAGVMVFGSDYHVQWINRRVGELLGGGIDRADLIGSRCTALCGADAAPCDDCPVSTVFQSGDAFHQERTRTQDGETRHYYVSAFPLLTVHGEVDEVLLTMQDLTDLDTLRASEARYQMLFQSSADAMFTADTTSLGIRMTNREASRLTGQDEASLSGRKLLDLHPESARESMAGFYGRIVTGGGTDNVETELIGPGGEILACNTMGTLFQEDAGPVLLVEFRDVSQVRRLQAELAKADHLITLGTMNAGIAHEFKNRLAPLRAFAQLLQIPGDHGERIARHAPGVVREVDRLSALVRDILDYARPTGAHRSDVDMVELVDNLCAGLAREHADTLARADITVRGPEAGAAALTAHVDPDQVRRVLRNLFGNAVDACAKRPASGHTVSLDVLRRDGDTVLRLQDTGSGITPEDRERIFDPFFTTKGPKGTGLGMCIVESMVKINRGEIRVESEPGRGTVVEVVFPSASRDEERAA